MTTSDTPNTPNQSPDKATSCTRCGELPANCECCTPSEMQMYMTFAALRAANVSRAAKWNAGADVPLLFRAVELGEEAGEVLGAVKKLHRLQQGMKGGKDTRENLIEELGDVVICADLLAEPLGIDLAAAVASKFNATSEKHGFPERLPLSPSPSSNATANVLGKIREIVNRKEPTTSGSFDHAWEYVGRYDEIAAIVKGDASTPAPAPATDEVDVVQLVKAAKFVVDPSPCKLRRDGYCETHRLAEPCAQHMLKTVLAKYESSVQS